MIRYWRNQHGSGVTVDDDTYTLMEGCARLEGKSVDEWFSDVVRSYCWGVLSRHDNQDNQARSL